MHQEMTVVIQVQALILFLGLLPGRRIGLMMPLQRLSESSTTLRVELTPSRAALFPDRRIHDIDKELEEGFLNPPDSIIPGFLDLPKPGKDTLAAVALPMK